MDKQISPISLKDLMGDSYEVESYLSPEDLEIIRNVFKDKNVLRVLRKVLLPTIADSNLPMEDAIGNDVWMAGRDWGMIPTEQTKALVLGRQEAIKFIVGGIMRLKGLANAKEESPQERTNRLKKDSTK